MKSRESVPASVASLPKSYLSLLGQFPLRPIKTVAQYERAARLVRQLALREGELDDGEEAYLDVLEALLERYDEEHSPMATDTLTPTELLRTLVEQAGMTVSELGTLLGSKGAASELLSGKRKEPSKAQIAKLCARFKVNAGAFLTPAKAPAHAA